MVNAQRSSVSTFGYGFVIIAALAPRIIFSIYYPVAEGDSGIYLRVAHNILQNGCVSLSMPESSLCIPHWGGNQLPGYPAFVAASMWLLPMIADERIAVGLTQSILSAAAITRMVHVLGRTTGGLPVAIAAGLLLALSPAHVAWSRWLLTESLATTITIWFFAEIIASKRDGRLHTVALSIAFGAAVLVRYDLIILALPLAAAAVWIHGFRHGTAAIGLICMLSAIPSGIWVWRSVASQLPFPPTSVVVDGRADLRGPTGFHAWLQTWIHNQYELKSTLWPALNLDYGAIQIPHHAYTDETEHLAVQKLLEELSFHRNTEFPLHIDEQFAEIAERRRTADPIAHWLINPAMRGVWLWFNPLTSFGWPSDNVAAARFAELLKAQDLPGLVIAAGDAPGTLAGKIGNTVYRYCLFVLLLFLTMWQLRHPGNLPYAILVIALLHAAGRTFFFAYSPWSGPESRYVVEAYPAIEIAIVLSLHARAVVRSGSELARPKADLI